MLRSTSRTFAPSRAKSRAAARPLPMVSPGVCPAPTTIPTLSVSLIVPPTGSCQPHCFVVILFSLSAGLRILLPPCTTHEGSSVRRTLSILNCLVLYIPANRSDFTPAGRLTFRRLAGRPAVPWGTIYGETSRDIWLHSTRRLSIEHHSGS